MKEGPRRIKESPYLILALLLLGWALRLFQITGNSFWVDEGFSVYLASHNIGEIIVGTAMDQHPPLYYVLLHYWMVLGPNMFVIRLLSASLGLVAIPLLYRFASSLFPAHVALGATFLLVISPAHIQYSQEARMYVLLFLSTLASTLFVWRLVEVPSRRFWLAYLFVTLVTLYTHSFSLFILLFQNLFVLMISLWQRRSELARRWLLAQGVLLLGFIPWVPTLIFQVTQHHLSWIPSPTLTSIRNTVCYLIFGLQVPSRSQAVLAALTVGALLLAIGFVVALREWRDKGLFVASWFAIPSLTIAALSTRYPLYQDKQFLVVLAPLLLLLALSISRMSIPGRALLFLVLLTITMPSLHRYYFLSQKQEWREVARYIDAHAQPGDTIFLNAAAGALTLDYYLTSGLPEDGYPQPYDLYRGGFDGEPTTPEVIDRRLGRLAQRHCRLWLVQYAPEFWDSQGLIPAWLDRMATQLPVPEFFGLDVRLYDLATGGTGKSCVSRQ